jgi:hypothetical protein
LCLARCRESVALAMTVSGSLVQVNGVQRQGVGKVVVMAGDLR